MLAEGSAQRKVGEFCPQMDIQSYNKRCVSAERELGSSPRCAPGASALSPLACGCAPASVAHGCRNEATRCELVRICFISLHPGCVAVSEMSPARAPPHRRCPPAHPGLAGVCPCGAPRDAWWGYLTLGAAEGVTAGGWDPPLQPVTANPRGKWFLRVFYFILFYLFLFFFPSMP